MPLSEARTSLEGRGVGTMLTATRWEWFCPRCNHTWPHDAGQQALGHFNLLRGARPQCAGMERDLVRRALPARLRGWHRDSRADFTEWQAAEGAGGGKDVQLWEFADFEAYSELVVALVRPLAAHQAPHQGTRPGWQDDVYQACKELTVDLWKSESVTQSAPPLTRWPRGLVWEMHWRSDYQPWMAQVVQKALEESVGNRGVQPSRPRDIVQSDFVRDFTRRSLEWARLDSPPGLASCPPPAGAPPSWVLPALTTPAPWPVLESLQVTNMAGGPCGTNWAQACTSLRRATSGSVCFHRAARGSCWH